MAVCNSCGGVIGRDCFNPMECAMITDRMEAEQEQRVRAATDAMVDNHFDLQHLFYLHGKLIKHLEAQGVDLSGYHKELNQELPF